MLDIDWKDVSVIIGVSAVAAGCYFLYLCHDIVVKYLNSRDYMLERMEKGLERIGDKMVDRLEQGLQEAVKKLG
eukprot:1635700-Rhodomonas_salina.5